MKNVIVSLVMLTLATSAWAGTLVYDFEDESQLADWFEVPTLDGLPYTAQWSVENGELVGILRDFTGVMGQGLGVGDDTWTNYTFEAQFRIEESLEFPGGSNPGLLLCIHWHLPPGVTDGTKFSLFFFGPRYSPEGWNGIGYWRSGEGDMRVEDIDPPVEEKRWYTARIEYEDANYRMFLDGKLVAECKTSSPGNAYGVAGFAVRNSIIHFDNVVITGDSIPNMLSVAAVSPRSRLATTWGYIRE